MVSLQSCRPHSSPFYTSWTIASNSGN